MAWRIPFLALILAWLTTPALAAGVPLARDLARDAEAAKRIQGAVLVVFVGDHCAYCKTVVNDFLTPMSRLPEYQGKVVIRQVELSGKLALRDFQGRLTQHQAFAQTHGIRLTPTILLFSPEGEVLVPPVVGLTTLDYYWQRLDEAIDAALSRVRGAPLPAASGA